MQYIAYLLLVVGAAVVAQADTITLREKPEVTGRFLGFAERKFVFKPTTGPNMLEYPLNVKSIVLEKPLVVDMEMSHKDYAEVQFLSFDANTLHLNQAGKLLNERIILLRKMTVLRTADVEGPLPSAPDQPVPDAPAPDQPVAVESVPDQPIPPESVPEPPAAPIPDPPVAPLSESPASPTPSPAPAVKLRLNSGNGHSHGLRRDDKWREVESKETNIISQGDVVEIKDQLVKGYINIVHFHYPKALASVREGNYIEALAAHRSSRIKILRVVVSDFKAPICESLEIKSLPQFWFYDAQGKLVKKLTDRFTEGDIDAAVKQTKQGTR